MNFTKNDVSRRGFMRLFGAAGVTAATLPVIGQSHYALAQAAQTPAAGAAGARRRGMGGGAGSDFGDMRVRDANAVIISSNENPLGPATCALEAIQQYSNSGGRYHQEAKSETVKAFSDTFDLKTGYVSMYPGSGNAVDLALYSNIGPDKPLVVADPSYEQGPRAATVMKAKLFSVPLTKDGRHDVKAMAAATPKAGAYYIVNPNNPTGTMTPKEDLVWLLEHKAPGSVLVIDEAYFHFSNDDSMIDQVAKDKDVIVTRTFSKIYGMAGLRAGFFIAKPELIEKLSTLDQSVGRNGSGSVSMGTAHAATASVLDKTLIPTRRKINADIRAGTLEWMEKSGYKYYPGSQANFFMVDVKRPGREFSALMQKQDVFIGRTWAAMPNYVRVTVGTAEEMQKFQVAFKKSYETAPAAAHLDLPYTAYSELDRHYA
ncbi:MAG TPA: aminotransferase class I/II-fold pyridoxal phosphate-dependent enzyme [Acidobacteriaceae bacterium]|jgi:histidinol-phosphate aminotransferase|nr:aminotransferase class I/II-fold pyridoxal phosphate-dependent enzyme [Acidobacteriaceae bacterium]